MRTLTIREMDVVAGGDQTWEDIMAFGSAVTAAAGVFAGTVGMSLAQWAGLSAGRQAAVATYFGFWGSGITGAALIGWGVGDWLNDHTAIQEFIAERLDTFVGEGPDGDG